MTDVDTLAASSTVHLDDLAEILEAPGPFATVVTEIRPDLENAAARRELRWKEMRQHLEAAGCTEPALEAIEAEFLDNPDHRGALAVIANSEGLLHASRRVEAPDREVIRWASLPTLTPMIAWRQASPPHVVVLIDREGADILLSVGGTAVTSVEGPDNVINKPSAGGWSHRRIQARAEDSWQRNARTVAKVVDDMARTARARPVLVGGDEQAVRLLLEALSKDTAGNVEKLEAGSRQSGFDEVAADVMRHVATAAAEDTTRFLETFREELRRHGRAVEGAEPTLEALARAQVAVLGVHDDGDEAIAFFGPQPGHVSSDASALSDAGVDQPTIGRRVDVVVRSAVLTGSGVQVVPWHAGPRDGLGGLLRWSD